MTETIDHPAHYKSGGIEVIDIIDAFKLDFNRGNALKYLLRAGRKTNGSEIEDLEKAAWYINRLIAKCEQKNNE